MTPLQPTRIPFTSSLKIDFSNDEDGLTCDQRVKDEQRLATQQAFAIPDPRLSLNYDLSVDDN